MEFADEAPSLRVLSDRGKDLLNEMLIASDAITVAIDFGTARTGFAYHAVSWRGE